MPEARAVIEPFSGICIQGAREQGWASVCQDYVRSWHITTDRVLTADGRYWSNSGHCLALALNGSVANDRAARLAAIPAGESPANRGVQSLL
jgi:hypothetical protein